MESQNEMPNEAKDKDSDELCKLRQQVGVMKGNYCSLQNELKTLKEQQHTWQQTNSLSNGEVVVNKSDLDKLAREVRMLKAILSRTFNQDVFPTLQGMNSLQSEMETIKQTMESTQTECHHWRSQCQNVMESAQHEKEEKLALTCELQETSEQLSQQSEFCATMGAACCTLLWRVSRCEDSIPSILVGTKVDEFLGVISSTLESYLQTYQSETAPADNSEEMQFVLALCGIITNIAASAYGRDFVMKHQQGELIIDTAIKVIQQEPCKKFAKMKNLILMALYNLTINQKGLKYLSSKSELLPLLSWQIQSENELENQLHSIRLVQSLLCEQPSPQLISQAKEMMQGSWFDVLCSNPNKQLREAAVELRTDIYVLLSEQ